MQVICPKCSAKYEIAPNRRLKCHCGMVLSVDGSGKLSVRNDATSLFHRHPALVIVTLASTVVVAAAAAILLWPHPEVRHPAHHDHHAADHEEHVESKEGVPGGSRRTADMVIAISENVRIELVKVEPGSFEMSSKNGADFNDEVPHTATLTRDFYIGNTEVTQAQYRAVTGVNPSEFKGDDLPVERVSWYDAMKFCAKLNGQGKAPAGWKFTLPTETQWEYAARGGKRSRHCKYSGSDDCDEVAWYCDNSSHMTHPVGKKLPNELGLFDMSGNVWEWCLDDWQEDSSKTVPEFSRESDAGGAYRVVRGGGCISADHCSRSSRRLKMAPGNCRGGLRGFRVVLVPVR